MGRGSTEARPGGSNIDLLPSRVELVFGRDVSREPRVESCPTSMLHYLLVAQLS